jgi:hypothetical protein
VRILIKTVFGRTLFHSQDVSVTMEVEKGDTWEIQISGMERNAVDEIMSNQADIHAFYFEPGHKWWLSDTKMPQFRFDETRNKLTLIFDSIYQYKVSEM